MIELPLIAKKVNILFPAAQLIPAVGKQKNYGVAGYQYPVGILRTNDIGKITPNQRKYSTTGNCHYKQCRTGFNKSTEVMDSKRPNSRPNKRICQP